MNKFVHSVVKGYVNVVCKAFERKLKISISLSTIFSELQTFLRYQEDTREKIYTNKNDVLYFCASLARIISMFL